MLVIDSHVHLLTEQWRPKEFLLGLAKIGNALSGISAEIIIKEIFPNLWDENGLKKLDSMENSNINVSLVHPIDFGMAAGCSDTEASIYQQNLSLWMIAKKNRGKIFSSAGADPRREDALAILEEGINKWDAIALKLHPGSGFYPNERICYPLYEKAGELNVPVIIHTGAIASPLKSKYCLPVYVDEVASDFPDLKIVMAHAGYRWWPEALNLCEVNPNLYLDLSGWQEQYKNPALFYNELRSILDGIGSERVMWGTDGPMYSQILADKEWLEAFSHASDKAPEVCINFEDKEINDLLGLTALSFYNLQLV